MVAPVTHSSLFLREESAEIDSHGVASAEPIAGDGELFKVREGVPRMIPARDSSVSTDDGATQRSFGAKWAQYADEDAEHLSEFQYRWFDERFGFGDETRLASFLSLKGRILDAGTGPGLCAARCARLTEGRVVGMDLSESVSAAKRRNRRTEKPRLRSGTTF